MPIKPTLPAQLKGPWYECQDCRWATNSLRNVDMHRKQNPEHRIDTDS